MLPPRTTCFVGFAPFQLLRLSPSMSHLLSICIFGSRAGAWTDGPKGGGVGSYSWMGMEALLGAKNRESVFSKPSPSETLSDADVPLRGSRSCCPYCICPLNTLREFVAGLDRWIRFGPWFTNHKQLMDHVQPKAFKISGNMPSWAPPNHSDFCKPSYSNTRSSGSLMSPFRWDLNVSCNKCRHHTYDSREIGKRMSLAKKVLGTYRKKASSEPLLARNSKWILLILGGEMSWIRKKKFFATNPFLTAMFPILLPISTPKITMAITSGFPSQRPSRKFCGENSFGLQKSWIAI